MSLNSYDISTVLKAYPLNTPPFSYDRVLYAVTIPGSSTLTTPEVNQVTITGFDLQDNALSLQLDEVTTSNGTFSQSGSTITYSPSEHFADNTVDDPTSSYFDRFRGRLSDGTNLSPFIDLRVVGFRRDTQPSGAADGVPDSWMTTYYGSSSGSTADADTDADGLNNLEEFLLGTDPTDSESSFKVTQFSPNSLEWTAQLFDVYTIQSSLDLSTWDTVRIVSQTSDTATLSTSDLPTPSSGNTIFFRVQRSQ